VLWVWVLGNRERPIGGEIPYRCLLPRGLEGLLVACRSASTTNEANYTFRVIRNMQRIGEAAGVAAAACAELETTPRALDVRLVQNVLKQSGALGVDVHPGPVVAERPLEELRAALAGDPCTTADVPLVDAVWLLAQGGDQARVVLQDLVQNGPAQARFWAAVALAWHRDPLAVSELAQAVEERMFARSDFTPYHRNTVPLWMSAMVLLGRVGDARAVPALLAVLEDRSAPLDALIAAARALGRIGEREASVPALERLLAREDLPRERFFQQTNLEGRWPAGEDGLWQIELAVAEVLARLGAPQPQVVARYQTDPRNHVRRYATAVLCDQSE
jgi:HEAT repeat protein